MTTLADQLRDVIVEHLEMVTQQIPVPHDSLTRLADEMVQLAVDKYPWMDRKPK
jgi:hypothetical protein